MSDQRDIPSTGTVVVRKGRIVLASDGAAALLRQRPEALEGMALSDIFAPEDRARLADRYERRMRGEPVPSDYEAVVLRADGTRATFDLHVDREGRDVVIRYRDISAEMDRRTRLEAFAALGAAIQRERTEAEIFDRIKTALPDLGISPVLLRPTPEGVRVEWSVLPPEVEGEFQALFARALTGFTGRWTRFSRKAWEEGVAFTDEWGAEAARFVPEPFALRARQLTSLELSRAIAVRIDERAGPRFYLVLACSWLRGEDVAAGRLFGAQVAAALDAAITIADLSRRNAELAALNRLGELAGELEQLDDFLRQADEAIFRASGAVGLAVYLVREDEGLLRRIHESLLTGPSSPETASLASAAGDAIRDRTARVVPEAEGPAEVACVPLLARGKVLGLLCARFAGEPGLAKARLELLVSFAAHYAGAIQSHQLLADLRRRLSDLTAVHAVTGQIFASRPGDVAGMLRDGCREVGAALSCPSVAAFLAEEGGAFLQSAALVGPPLDPGSLRFPVTRDGLAAEAIRAGAPVWSPDATRDPRSSLFGRTDVPTPAILVVPLLARGATRGVLFLACEAGRAFSDSERALAMALGGELAMGLENAELHAAAKEQVRHLSLLGEMGRTLAESLDLDQVLAVGVDAACRLLATDRAFVMLGDSVRGELPVAAATGLLARELLDGFRPSLERSGVYRRVVQERRPVMIEDMDAFPEADPAYRQFGSRAMLAVPLLSSGEVSGVLVVDDCRRSRCFTEAEQERAVAVANRLAVAIENARLYAEARGRLSELSTVIDVARVVSSTLDLEEVLSAGAEHLKDTLGAAACTILLEDAQRRELRRAAHRGPPAGPDALPLDRPSLAREALEARAPLTGRTGEGEAGSPLLAVPLHVRDQPVGVALVVAEERDRSFTIGELSRAMAIASQLAVAVDNARLYQEARRRAEELALLHEVGRSLVASLDIETVLDAGVRNLARMVDAPAAMLALATPDGRELEFRAVWGGPPGVVGRRPSTGRPGSLGELALNCRQPILVEDAANDPRVSQDLRAELGARAYLVLPLLVRERFIGSALIVDDRHPRRFTPAEVERATAVANQLAVAVENARLYEDLRLSYEQLAQAQKQLVQRERLAALGELSAVVAHEVRNPLGVIFNSLGSLRRLLRPQGDARMLLDIVGEEADRLNRIVGDLIDFARPVTPVLRPEPLEQVVDQAVAAAVGDSGVEVERDVDPDLPPVALDARLLHQALLNVAANAVQAMPKGGRLSVRVRRDQGGVLLELTDTGLGIPEEIRPRIFEPFFTTKASGTGLGLAVVKRIVEGHGGDISISSRHGVGTVVRIRLPVALRTPGPVETGGALG